MTRVLQATINAQAVGELQEINGLWAFQYHPVWLSHPASYALSPHLPLQAQPVVDGGSVRPVQWYFDNLLPEEGQRTLLAGSASLDAADAFGLLQYYGAESAGSLTLLPPEHSALESGVLRPLADAELSQRILNMPKVPLAQGATKRMSLAGAQHKLAVVLKGDGLYEPSGPTPSTQILKPDHPDGDYPSSVCQRRLNIDPPCRSNIDPGRVAEF